VTIFFTNYNFVHDTMKDKVPREHWDKPIVFAFSRAIALAWGIALLVMTAAALGVPHQHGASVIDILCNYVFGIAPLFVAAVAQHIIIRKYKRGIATIKAASAAEPAAAAPFEAPALITLQSAASAQKAAEGVGAAAVTPFEAHEAHDDVKGMGAASKAGAIDTRKVADVHIVGEEQV